MAERLCNVGPNLDVYKVNVDEVREQDINARVMPPEMMERLTETVQKEARLEQLPFTVKRDDHFEMVSGHHRLRAARAAGLTEIFVLVDTRDLSKSKVRAKQIAHNRIAGEDDPQTLAKLYAEMQSVDDILESFLRPEDFDDVKQLETAAITDIAVAVPWKHLTLVFMPSAMEAIERIEAIVKRVPKEADTIGLVSVDVLDRFRKAAAALGRTEDVRSLGAIVTRMTEIVEDHLARAEPASAATGGGIGATTAGADATSSAKRRKGNSRTRTAELAQGPRPATMA